MVLQLRNISTCFFLQSLINGSAVVVVGFSVDSVVGFSVGGSVGPVELARRFFVIILVVVEGGMVRRLVVSFS